MTTDILLRLLPWVLPPLVGALIGYVTNYVAIRMLFRPLTEKRIFGVRLPLTPGIIPKQRADLATSIGRMVSRELITAEAMEKQLSAPGFRGRLEQNIRSFIENLLNKPISSLRDGSKELLFDSGERFLAGSLHRFFASRSFIYAVRKLLTGLIRNLGNRQVGDILVKVDIRRLVKERLLPALAGKDLGKKIAAGLERIIHEQKDRLIPEDLAAALAQVVAGFLPQLFDSLFRWLRQQDTRTELQTRGKSLLRDILDKLNIFQKFLMSAAQYDRTLEEKMPDIVTDAIDSLESAAYDEENLAKLKRVLERAFLNWREKVTGANNPGAEGRIRNLVEKGLAVLAQEDVRDRLSAALAKSLEEHEGTLQENLTRFLGLHEQDLLEFASFHILEALSQEERSRAIAAEIVSFARGFLEEHQEQTLSELLHIEVSTQKLAAAFLTEHLIGILKQRLPALLQSFDIEEMVVTKINALDVIDVEHLLLMVIAKHLKWINLFGALLGALIGFFQVLLNFLQAAG